jgi:hypothetical protein
MQLLDQRAVVGVHAFLAPARERALLDDEVGGAVAARRRLAGRHEERSEERENGSHAILLETVGMGNVR